MSLAEAAKPGGAIPESMTPVLLSTKGGAMDSGIALRVRPE
jgi:hypothetical protein